MTEEHAELHAEATGETVGEAKWQALRRLETLAPGLDRSTVRFQIVSEGQRGLLGVGYAPARVVATATAPPPTPVPPETLPEHAQPVDPARPPAVLAVEVVKRVTSALGVDCRVDARESEHRIAVSCTGPELGLLIGRRGQTIDAIQYLVNAIVLRRLADGQAAKEVVVDASGYRARREAALHALAVQSAEHALERGAAVELEPMTAVERKVVHLRLKDFPGVVTSSAGEEPHRHVIVAPSGE